jgi:hypothetical protein
MSYLSLLNGQINRFLQELHVHNFNVQMLRVS